MLFSRFLSDASYFVPLYIDTLPRYTEKSNFIYFNKDHQRILMLQQE